MKFMSFVVLTIFLISCGAGGSKNKVVRKSLDKINDELATHGIAVGLFYDPGAGEHVVVVCHDSETTDRSTDNYDRVKSLQTYRDSLHEMDQVLFTKTKVDVWIVEWAVNEAIEKLQKDLTGTSCPEAMLGIKEVN